jgi:phosphohistidine phosphatase
LSINPQAETDLAHSNRERAMRRLMLLRHAKTETEAPSGKDHDRRLDDRGRSDAADIGAWMARHRHVPDLVLVSTAVRAQQTWQIVTAAMRATSNAISQPLAADLPELYGAGPSQLLQIIHAVDTENPQRLLIVGHNPGLHELALGLIGSGDATGRKVLGENLPTSGMAVIDFPIPDWNDVSFRGGRLELFVSPKLLKKAAGKSSE